MSSPLVTRLTEDLNWPRLSSAADLAAYLDRPGAHCLFVPGDPARNLETGDAAVILPELRMTFQHAFDCAVVDDAIDAEVRETYKALKTPAFIFLRDGVCLGSIQKVRDWDDYLGRITQILSVEAA